MELKSFYEAVKIAEQNQWSRNYQTPAEVVLDRFFWQALGKGLGWGIEPSGSIWQGEEQWKIRWHWFIDHLAERGEINSFFEELLKEPWNYSQEPPKERKGNLLSILNPKFDEPPQEKEWVGMSNDESFEKRLENNNLNKEIKPKIKL